MKNETLFAPFILVSRSKLSGNTEGTDLSLLIDEDKELILDGLVSAQTAVGISTLSEEVSAATDRQPPPTLPLPRWRSMMRLIPRLKKARQSPTCEEL